MIGLPFVRGALALALAAAGLGAALVLVWFYVNQRRLIYYPLGERLPPAGDLLPGASEVTLTTADGVVLGGWFVPARGAAVATVLVFNGNAGNRADRAELARALRARGLAVLLFDYRGYGGNPGQPSEAGLIADARAARAYLDARDSVPRQPVVYFGESLGAAVAVALAAERPPAALVLRSPFSSLVSVGRLHYPYLPVRWLLNDRYDSLSRIGSVEAPLLVIAGESDGIVPMAESRALFAAAPRHDKAFLSIAAADHNDVRLVHGEELVNEMMHFLSRTGALVSGG